MGTAVNTQESGSPGSIASWWRGRYGFQMLVEIGIVAALLMTLPARSVC